ncbi:MAG: flagellar assembly protein FliW [Gemmatimonadetes bacterium]|nr:flagellar assembly protein FliW [Gemmatimonadota bacterium]
MTATAPLPAATTVARRIDTELFGAIAVTDDQLLTFAEGPLGFPACTQWVLLGGATAGTAWLQSAEHAPLAFLLVDPFVAFEGYAVDLSPMELARLGATRASELAVFAIVTLPESREAPVTANLLGPVVINIHGRTGAQLVTSSDTWSVKEPFALEALQ